MKVGFEENGQFWDEPEEQIRKFRRWIRDL